MILRPGIITQADFEKALGKPVVLDPTLNQKPEPGKAFKPKAPGMKYRHYAPKAEMIIFEGEYENVMNFIFFGSCGVLDERLTEGHIIVPTEAYRDEGTSYHYMPAGDYVRITNAEKVAEILSDMFVSLSSVSWAYW